MKKSGDADNVPFVSVRREKIVVMGLCISLIFQIFILYRRKDNLCVS